MKILIFSECYSKNLFVVNVKCSILYIIYLFCNYQFDDSIYLDEYIRRALNANEFNHYV